MIRGFTSNYDWNNVLVALYRYSICSAENSGNFIFWVKMPFNLLACKNQLPSSLH